MTVMTAPVVDISSRVEAVPLIGRAREKARLDDVLADVGAGPSRTLVLRGLVGSGKTALLSYATGAARGLRVLRITGVESEMRFAYAGLQQLLTPLVGDTSLSALPAVQREALEGVLGLRAPDAAGPTMVGLAVLNLLSRAAGDNGLLCVIDDSQWLDQESTDVLAFVGRRSDQDGVGMLFAVREMGSGEPELPCDGVAELWVGGLAPDAAGELLSAASGGPVAAGVRERVVERTGGSPLALLHLGRTLSRGQLAGREPLPEVLPLATGVERALAQAMAELPEPAQRVLVLAAADPTGDASRIRRAAEARGVPFEALGAAEEHGLVDLSYGVAFHHPLMRAAVLAAAGSLEVHAAHAALAEATDPDLEPDRRAWHRALAAAGPDEETAAALEASAERASRRGGTAAAGAFLRKAGDLSPEPDARARRYLAAATAALYCASADTADELIGLAEQQPGGDRERAALVSKNRALAAVLRGRLDQAAPLLTAAARTTEPVDPQRARSLHLQTLWVYTHLGRNAPELPFAEAVRAATQAPSAQPPSAIDLLTHGFGARFDDSYATAVPPLRKALAELEHTDLRHARPVVLDMALYAAAELWDDTALDTWSARRLQSARALDALALLPLALSERAWVELLSGRFEEASALTEEARQITQVTGVPGLLGPVAPGETMEAALRGDEDRARELAAELTAHAVRRRTGLSADMAAHALGLLELGYGRHTDAVRQLRFALAAPHTWVATRALPDLVEAAVRADEPELAHQAAARLTKSAQAAGTPLGLGVEAGARALLTDNLAEDEAEKLYETALEHLRQTRAVISLARTHLLYGEWLRRRRRRRDAREHLRGAHATFTAFGMKAFAERARAELETTGEHARSRGEQAPVDELTPQEARIAQLAAEGASNVDIAEQLYVSRRTVEAHLTKVYAKLGISSRTQLAYALLRDSGK